jgi:hypothetical protein
VPHVGRQTWGYDSVRVPSDSYLRLIPKVIADAILRSTAGQCHAFAVACADLAVEHCAHGVGLDDGGALTLPALRDQVRAVVGSRESESVNRMLASHEDTLYTQLCAMRADEGDAPYGEFVRVSTLRHAVRALRAALSNDAVASAASAAFETISATRSESDVERLTLEILAPRA